MIETSTEPGLRRLGVRCGDGEETGSGRAVLESIYTALRAGGETSVQLDAQGLAITIPFNDADELLSAQRALAARLPDLSETTLLKDVLQPAELILVSGVDSLRASETYIEEVSLRQSKDQWLDNARRLEDAASLLGAPDDGASLQANETRRLIAAVLQHDAEAWRQLNAASHVVYRVRLSDEYQTEREWSVEPGAARVLTASAARWRDEQVKRAFRRRWRRGRRPRRYRHSLRSTHGPAHAPGPALKQLRDENYERFSPRNRIQPDDPARRPTNWLKLQWLPHEHLQ